MSILEKDEKALFDALLEGDDKKIEYVLYRYVFDNEYCWAHDGGEPSLGHILAIKLLEKLRGQKCYMSIIYQTDYLRHVGIKEKEGKHT